VTEWRLFSGDTPYVSSFEFHADRSRAAHLEQAGHRQRLLTAASLIFQVQPKTVVDLGCGDGGLLSLIEGSDLGIECWGYDFCPANADGWAERVVQADQRDVFTDHDVPRWGELVVLTEVLEHLADPHGVLAWVAGHCRWVVASSPRYEDVSRHADEHAWAWDERGYADLFAPHFEVISQHGVDWSQVLLARSRIDVGVSS
jgi:hypothetical protein